ncbi:von Willebrand factor type A domain-containing protein [Saccharicrinis sp. FJH62]|uniref:YfbK domain-containing protein n=1 Tax=Saccharicrinis sp. FJH62 TaxID=3344657 RepID=UPI0035D498ED
MKTIGLIACLIICFYTIGNAQTLTVSGTVKDHQNKSMHGVYVDLLVPVKKDNKVTYDQTAKTRTDSAGYFKVECNPDDSLVLSYPGFVTVKVPVKQEQLDITMKPDYVELNEVIIVRDQPIRRSFTIGAASAVATRTSGIRVRGGSRVNNQALFNSNLTSSGSGNGVPVLSASAEEYGKYVENDFILVKKEALSTFSLDVDAASYSNMRRMINLGMMPIKDAVRIEELINYFKYQYPEPVGDDPVNIITETTECPWNTEHKLFRIGIKAKDIPKEKLPASNFVFLIDVSGSMQSMNKIGLVKSSLKFLTNNLREKDKVSIVVYAGAAGVVLEPTNGKDKQKILDAIEALETGGSTAGAAGIKRAYEMAEQNFIENGNNRIILCTDGDFNVGVSSPSELENLIEEQRKSGVYLTILGYGMGNYKDNKLQVLAQKGNGNHAYIDNLLEANKVIVEEFGGTMYTVAKDVKLQLEFNPANVNGYRLIGYESRLLNKEDFNDDKKDAGEIGMGHTVTALYEIVPVGIELPSGKVDDLKYQPGKKEKIETKKELDDELLTIKLRYKLPSEEKSKKMEIPVLVKSYSNIASEDQNFIMAVAMFGQLLKDSEYKGDADYKNVIELAKKGLGEDENGYRREFVRLVKSVKDLN